VLAGEETERGTRWTEREDVLRRQRDRAGWPWSFCRFMWIRGKQRSFFSFDKPDGLSAKLAEHVHSIMDAAGMMQEDALTFRN